jgi:hypothetical protein
LAWCSVFGPMLRFEAGILIRSFEVNGPVAGDSSSGIPRVLK